MSVPTPVLAAGLGWVAGMRSMTPLALMSHALGQERRLPWVRRRRQPARAFANRNARPWFTLAAAGELVADKLPMTPPRTDPPALLGRLAAGAAAGAAVAQVRGSSVLGAALAGGAAAVVASFAMMRLRGAVGAATGLPDAAVAVAEDALALGLGSACVRAAVA